MQNGLNSKIHLYCCWTLSLKNTLEIKSKSTPLFRTLWSRSMSIWLKLSLTSLAAALSLSKLTTNPTSPIYHLTIPRFCSDSIQIQAMLCQLPRRQQRYKSRYPISLSQRITKFIALWSKNLTVGFVSAAKRVSNYWTQFFWTHSHSRTLIYQSTQTHRRLALII